jgi:predicted TIM-barrel fold metal-dependent hydrolase
MARIPFTDTHVHFHDIREPALSYDWVAPDSPADPILGDHSAIKAVRYWADDWLMESRFQNVERVVHVEATQWLDDPVEETRWLQAFTDRLGVPHGAVVQAYLARPGLRDVLERHAQYPILRGIRDPDREAFLTDDWRKGYALLEEFDLVCCNHTGYERMPEARRLIEDFPGITYCIDHTGWPTARDAEYFEKWKLGIHEIAKAPNAVIKISGLGMCDHRWTVESIRPWVLESIEAFGTDRCVFATNWTVDKLFSTYGDVIDAYAEIISGFAEAEQLALFSGNAKRIFRLD